MLFQFTLQCLVKDQINAFKYKGLQNILRNQIPAHLSSWSFEEAL